MQVCTDHFTVIYKLHVLITLNFHTCRGGYGKTQVANFRNCTYNGSTVPLKSQPVMTQPILPLIQKPHKIILVQR